MDIIFSQRPYSTTRRIKTHSYQATSSPNLGQRPYSTTRRIKTSGTQIPLWLTDLVRDHTPLQEGLRPLRIIILRYEDLVRDHTPLQEGLRRHVPFLNSQ